MEALPDADQICITLSVLMDNVIVPSSKINYHTKASSEDLLSAVQGRRSVEASAPECGRKVLGLNIIKVRWDTGIPALTGCNQCWDCHGPSGKAGTHSRASSS